MSKERQPSALYNFKLPVSDDEQPQQVSKTRSSVSYYLESTDEQPQKMSKQRQTYVTSFFRSSNYQQMLKRGQTSADDEELKRTLERKGSVAYSSELTRDKQPQQMSNEKEHPSVIPKTLEPLPEKASSSSVEVHYLSFNLPPEILEIIFCLIPLQELLLSCRLVCKQWNDIIMRKKACMVATESSDFNS